MQHTMYIFPTRPLGILDTSYSLKECSRRYFTTKKRFSKHGWKLEQVSLVRTEVNCSRECGKRTSNQSILEFFLRIRIQPLIGTETIASLGVTIKDIEVASY